MKSGRTLKTLLTAIVVLASMITGMAQVPSYVPANGLVGWWPFNGNANDESGNGNNGTVGSGVTLSLDRFMGNNAAYDFNGSGNISLTSLPTIGSQNFTISGWVKTNNTSVRKGIACWGQDQPWQSTYFFITSSGYLKFDFAYNGGPQSSTFIADNNWHFVAVTCNSGLIQLFLDGQINGSPLQMNPNINGANKALGANIDNSGSNNFVGSLDDIGIWNLALTQNEITQLYTGSPCVNYQIINVTDTLIINANLSGINPVTFQNTIKVYPNPSSSQITIDFGANFNTLAGYTMRIQNAVGQTVYTTGVTQQQFTSNLNTWTGSGIYFVYLIDAQGNTVDVKKIILQ